jgi:nitrogen fixation protein FixH
MIMQKEAVARPLTGRMVLLMLLAFFGVIITVNMVMVMLASSTFSGLGDKNAYVAGISHNKSLADARAQDQRAWKVDASLRRVAQGRTLVIIVRSDAGALAETGVTVRFLHPSSANLDRVVVLASVSANTWRTSLELPAGVWDMVIEMRSRGTVVFMSRDRIVASDSRIDGDG